MSDGGTRLQSYPSGIKIAYTRMWVVINSKRSLGSAHLNQETLSPITVFKFRSDGLDRTADSDLASDTILHWADGSPPQRRVSSQNSKGCGENAGSPISRGRRSWNGCRLMGRLYICRRPYLTPCMEKRRPVFRSDKNYPMVVHDNASYLP